jgi:hypothetical protein
MVLIQNAKLEKVSSRSILLMCFHEHRVAGLFAFFLFEGIWALKKHYFCLCEWENNNTVFLGFFSRIRKDKRRDTVLLKFGPFLPFSFKLSMFYSALFYLCGRTISQLATLGKYDVVRLNLRHPPRPTSDLDCAPWASHALLAFSPDLLGMASALPLLFPQVL